MGLLKKVVSLGGAVILAYNSAFAGGLPENYNKKYCNQLEEQFYKYIDEYTKAYNMYMCLKFYVKGIDSEDLCSDRFLRYKNNEGKYVIREKDSKIEYTLPELRAMKFMANRQSISIEDELNEECNIK